MKIDILTQDVQNLFPFLEEVSLEAGNYTAINNSFGYSSYKSTYLDQECEIALAIILGGTGFILRRNFFNGQKEETRYDHFNINGELTFTSDKEVLKPLIVESHVFDPNNIYANHLYNYLCLEYAQTTKGLASTKLIYAVERELARRYKNKTLSINAGLNDAIILNTFKSIEALELDPVLTWEERQGIYKAKIEKLMLLLKTKARAHRKTKLLYSIGIFAKEVGSLIKRIAKRPFDNMAGIFYRYTIGKIIWFFNTVKNNLGYSVALAVYGPFTYYFITMPMNPHAMQAVGKVRATYLDTKAEISRLLSGTNSVINELKNDQAIAEDTTMALPEVNNSTDSVQTSQAASTSVNPADENAKILSNILYPSEIIKGQEQQYLEGTKLLTYKPQIMNMPTTTDVASVDAQSWNERMSNFKQMQIAYEENIEFASRMGRLEQLETQYNFPMQVENAWEELERYNQMIFKVREENPNLSAKMKQFLFNEVDRTQQLQLYLWDRMSRHILDQIYVMLDKDNEQQRNDYYVGRAFVFMEEMTQILSWRYKDLKKPAGYDRIEALAKFYNKSRQEHGSILKNLSANSDLFKQKDVYNTKEFRSYMKRQWEILYLQNAKAEEASNMGLNMYIWSVRNTVWILQSIYSAKKEELALLIKRDTTNGLFTPAELATRNKLSLLYETLFHNLTLEYVGIREEIMNRLPKDIESEQRKVVIDNLKEFFVDRDKLDGTNQALGQNDTEMKGTTL